MKNLLLLAVLALAAASQAQRYRVVTVGLLGTTSEVQAVNANGQVVGVFSTASQELHAFLYSGGALKDLGTLGGGLASAHG